MAAAAEVPALTEAIELLLKNEPPVFRVATETLFKVVKNIEAHPAEARYRELSVSSATFTGKIAPAKGGVRFLRALGFQKTTVNGTAVNGNTEKKTAVNASVATNGSASAQAHEAMVLAAPDMETLTRGKMALKAKADRERIQQQMRADKFELERQRDPANCK